jgi:hypothetical protein
MRGAVRDKPRPSGAKSSLYVILLWLIRRHAGQGARVVSMAG